MEFSTEFINLPLEYSWFYFMQNFPHLFIQKLLVLIQVYLIILVISGPYCEKIYIRHGVPKLFITIHGLFHSIDGDWSLKVCYFCPQVIVECLKIILSQNSIFISHHIPFSLKQLKAMDVFNIQIIYISTSSNIVLMSMHVEIFRLEVKEFAQSIKHCCVF